LIAKSLPTIVDCGRVRWKIENENNFFHHIKILHNYHQYQNFDHLLDGTEETTSNRGFTLALVAAIMNNQGRILPVSVWEVLCGFTRLLYDRKRTIVLARPAIGIASQLEDT